MEGVKAGGKDFFGFSCDFAKTVQTPDMEKTRGVKAKRKFRSFCSVEENVFFVGSSLRTGDDLIFLVRSTDPHLLIRSLQEGIKRQWSMGPKSSTLESVPVIG